MRQLALLAMAAVILAAAAPPASAQARFKVPFPFESGGKKFIAGDYVVSATADGQVALKQAATEKETALPVLERAKTPEAAGSAAPPPPGPGPVLLFHEVGNFEPSYTEYFTVYVLAEVWLPGQDGYVIRKTKGAHKDRLVKGEMKVE